VYRVSEKSGFPRNSAVGRVDTGHPYAVSYARNVGHIDGADEESGVSPRGTISKPVVTRTNRLLRVNRTRNRPYSPYKLVANHVVARSIRRVSDAEVIRRCILYDNAGWEELIRRHGGIMYVTIRKQLERSSPSRNGIAPEDILSRVFQKLLEQNCEVLRNLKNPDLIQTYLCQIARTVTVDCVREVHPELRQVSLRELDRLTVDPYETIDARENCARLEEAMDKLSDRHRLFLRLYYQEELAYKEIADLTRTPIRTVGTVLHRARKAVRTFLEEDGLHSVRKVR
jgi:RNA polymerase sigma factor (sigma-70 family)